MYTMYNGSNYTDLKLTAVILGGEGALTLPKSCVLSYAAQISRGT